MSVCNMAIEAGARAGMIAADEVRVRVRVRVRGPHEQHVQHGHRVLTWLLTEPYS